jgi:hypothetical protein
MNIQPTQTPFFFVSTFVTFESPEQNRDRVNGAIKRLVAEEIPFKQLELKVAGVDSTEVYPVLLLSCEDKNTVERIAKENHQSFYIEVNAFKVGTRIEVNNGAQHNVLGTLEQVQKYQLEPDQGYFADAHGQYFVWKS